MTLLNPVFLWMGMIAAAITVTIHLIITRQPLARVFPTARFVPFSPVVATSRAAKPDDALLLILRTLALLAAGLGLSAPVPAPTSVPERRVILVDAARDPGGIVETRDSARRWFRKGDIMIAFDSASRAVAHPDSVTTSPVSSAGNLSAALIGAIRAGGRLSRRADSVELVIVSSFSTDAVDAATDSIRSLWRGGARLVRVSPSETSQTATGRIPFPRLPDDPLVFTAGLASSGTTDLRVFRGEAADAPHSAVHWPSRQRPVFAIQRVPDTIPGLRAGGSLVLAPFARHWQFPRDSLVDARVVARWIDGEPAAIERGGGDGCIRSVAIGSELGGDIPLRYEFLAIFRALTSRCGVRGNTEMLSDASMARLGRGSSMAPAASFASDSDPDSPFTRFLLALSLVLLVAELAVRRGRRNVESAA